MLNITTVSTWLIVIGCLCASLAVPAVRRALHVRLHQIHSFFYHEEEDAPVHVAPTHDQDNWNYDMYSEES